MLVSVVMTGCVLATRYIISFLGASLFYHPSTSMSSKSSLGGTAFVVFGVLSVMTLKELNIQVTEPYMV